jgi:hypothetical protein
MLCKLFGHKWNYYKVAQHVRVCGRCKKLQYWTTFYPIPNPFWMTAVKYTDKGAREHVAGYGLPEGKEAGK